MRLPTTDEIMEHRLRWVVWTGIAILIAVAIGCVYGLLVAFWPKPAQGSEAQTVYGARLPGYSAGEFREPPVRILTRLNGQEQLTLQDILHRWPDITVPVFDLRLIAPNARQTILGVRLGNIAYKTALKIPRNTLYFHNSRIACAAFVSAMFRKCGVKGYSFAVNTMYSQMRQRGGKVVGARVSTRYTPYYKWYKAGDVIFFHKGGGRLGHVEIYAGRGLCAGTSSSRGRVAIRPLGNRGFSYMTVVRV